MTTDTTDRELLGVGLAIVALLVVLPAILMVAGLLGTGSMMHGAWDHGMWGSGAAAPGWAVGLWVVRRLLVLAALVGGGYLLYRALATRTAHTDPAVEELRRTYARGELSEEAFERRLARLQNDS